MKRFMPYAAVVLVMALAVGYTALMPSETRSDYVYYTGSANFSVDSATTQTTPGYYIGSLYDKDAFARFSAQTFSAGGTFDLNVLLDFSVDGVTWDADASIVLDALGATAVYDTLSTVTGAREPAWGAAKYFRLRLDPQSGHKKTIMRWNIKVPRNDRALPSTLTVN